MYLHNRAPPEDNVSPVPTKWRGATELYHVQAIGNTYKLIFDWIFTFSTLRRLV